MRNNIDRLREAHAAWNDRQWDDYADLLAERMASHDIGASQVSGKPAHLEAEQCFCRLYPDARFHIAPYVSVFASGDGRRVASVVRLTATLRPFPARRVAGHEAAPLPPHIDVLVVSLCAWTSGAISEQYRSWPLPELHLPR
ncbi:nuclear transport factor 2 family protein [Pseudoxanthomonas winnipegensis]|uniref:SnoaL-like domain-containing protein n=1 Tax=Pseudoxanthomonas winnipegensis TaxID=2480810 RepID=A0A4Q8L4A8_9GAMM|nr:nuclear transport factor 2 family protein [Pseudoxanthomonas winnipegensis]TAA20118.1 hypothetical protein EA660_18980 [Pseudoxanthomonas winnipegensis]